MRKTNWLAAVGAVVLLSLPGVGLSQATDTRCVGIQIMDARSPVAGVTKFSATKVVDLLLRAHTNDKLKGQHVFRFELSTPDHHLYQALDVPSSDPSSAASQRRLPGYPFPVKEKRPMPASMSGLQTLSVDSLFPVGGTAIVQSGLYGVWSVQVILDGARQPFCTATSFTIGP